MKCSNCQCELKEDMVFCPNCGQKIQKYKSCIHCGVAIAKDATICPLCKTKQEVVSKQVDPYAGYWKKPKVWIVSLLCIFLALGLVTYMQSHPLRVSKQTEITLKGNYSRESYYCNNQYGGHVAKDKNYLYYVMNQSLYRLDHHLENKELVLDDCEGYLTLVNQELYYCDQDYNYYCYNLKTKEKKLIQEKIYYPVIYQDKLYYQKDQDNESIYCYDLKSEEDHKLNNEVSYDLIIDEKNQKLYYLSPVDKKNTLKVMDLDGQNSQTIYDQEECETLTMNQNQLFVATSEGIMQITKKDHQVKQLVKTGSLVQIYQDDLLFVNNQGVQRLSLDSHKQTTFYKGMVTSLEVIGQDIIIDSYQDNKTMTLLVDEKGTIKELKQSQAVNKFDDARDF